MTGTPFWLRALYFLWPYAELQGWPPNSLHIHMWLKLSVLITISFLSALLQPFLTLTCYRASKKLYQFFQHQHGFFFVPVLRTNTCVVYLLKWLAQYCLHTGVRVRAPSIHSCILDWACLLLTLVLLVFVSAQQNKSTACGATLYFLRHAGHLCPLTWLNHTHTHTHTHVSIFPII